MRALIYDDFRHPIRLAELADPTPTADGVVIQVAASGLCRSDWHGWMGHDPDIRPPHVPGHELAGIVVAAGSQVRRWRNGDRATLPFCLGCGHCPQCQSGNQQICDHYYQPGFTGWGSFAEFVAVPYADVNLVALPENIDFVSAAILGCRFITAYRALVVQGRAQPGDWVAVHGCGGVGLSAILIAGAVGAPVIAIDISEEKLAFARKLGAAATLNAHTCPDIPGAIRELTGGGAHISMDALGSTATCLNSIACLRKRGRHLQVGLMTAEHQAPPIPMGPVIAKELELLGSHGMQAHQYPGMLQLINSGRLNPQQLLGKTVTLEQAAAELPLMDQFPGIGVTVIDRF